MGEHNDAGERRDNHNVIVLSWLKDMGSNAHMEELHLYPLLFPSLPHLILLVGG